MMLMKKNRRKEDGGLLAVQKLRKKTQNSNIRNCIWVEPLHQKVVDKINKLPNIKIRLNILNGLADSMDFQI